MRRIQKAFTLIELLVVITIIVVLLALLTPALDKAVYQAELTLCGANLHALATGVTTYALEHQRRYPHRPGVASEAVQQRESHDIHGGSWRTTERYDDRPYLRGYVDLNGLLNDPLSVAVDYENVTDETWVWTGYNLLYSWRFDGGYQGMMRIGDRMTWQSSTVGDTRLNRFQLIALDHNMAYPTGNAATTSHPDKDRVLYPSLYRDEPAGTSSQALLLNPNMNYTFSRWQNFTTHRRGDIDINVAHADGGVLRLIDVIHENDPRLVDIPMADKFTGQWVQVPAQ